MLFKTIGEVGKLSREATNAKVLFATSLVINAVVNLDVQSIKQIISRIDGGVPDASKRKNYANIFGSALDDVLAYEDRNMLKIEPEDYSIIALAKAVLWVSMSDPGNNAQKRKDKQDAIQIILERTGGRKNEPVKELITTNYVDPDWMKSLPS